MCETMVIIGRFVKTDCQSAEATDFLAHAQGHQGPPNSIFHPWISGLVLNSTILPIYLM